MCVLKTKMSKIQEIDSRVFLCIINTHYGHKNSCQVAVLMAKISKKKAALYPAVELIPGRYDYGKNPKKGRPMSNSRTDARSPCLWQKSRKKAGSSGTEKAYRWIKCVIFSHVPICILFKAVQQFYVIYYCYIVVITLNQDTYKSWTTPSCLLNIRLTIFAVSQQQYFLIDPNKMSSRTAIVIHT